MAKQTITAPYTDLRKQELISHLADSRRKISDERSVIKQQLNPKTQLNNFFSKNPRNAVIGSAVLGLAVTSILKRKKTRPAKKIGRKGLIMTLAGWGFALAKPSLKSLLIKQASSLATKQIAQRTAAISDNRQSLPSHSGQSHHQ